MQQPRMDEASGGSFRGRLLAIWRERACSSAFSLRLWQRGSRTSANLCDWVR